MSTETLNKDEDKAEDDVWCQTATRDAWDTKQAGGTTLLYNEKKMKALKSTDQVACTVCTFGKRRRNRFLYKEKGDTYYSTTRMAWRHWRTVMTYETHEEIQVVALSFNILWSHEEVKKVNILKERPKM